MSFNAIKKEKLHKSTRWTKCRERQRDIVRKSEGENVAERKKTVVKNKEIKRMRKTVRVKKKTGWERMEQERRDFFFFFFYYKNTAGDLFVIKTVTVICVSRL